MDIRVENWNGHEIRFLETIPGDWRAVLMDVTDALGLSARWVKRRLSKDVFSKHPLPTAGGTQDALIVNEFGIYECIFECRKPEAKAFKRWVYEVLQALRHASGLEGFQIFRMMDKEHQRDAMQALHDGNDQPTKRDYIKANTIADKAISTMYGYRKMLKKYEMAPDVLRERQPILDETVQLIVLARKYGLGISVSNAIYVKHCGKAAS